MANKKEFLKSHPEKKSGSTTQPIIALADPDLAALLLDHNPNAVFTIDKEGNCIFQNLSAQTLLYPSSQKPPNVLGVVPEIDLNRVRSCIKEGGNYNIFFERAERSYRIVVKGLPELGLAGVFVSDITDLTRIEADMLRSQNILRKVLDTDPNMIFVKDRNGRFVLANQAVADTYGTSVDLLIGKKDSDFNPNADEIDHFLNDDLEVIEQSSEKRILEESVTDAKGNSRFFSTVKRPLKLSQGEDTYVLGVSNDISAVKRLQEQLAQASKMEALGQLAGGIAHDFNNLLTAILGYADILKITHSTDENVVKPASMIQTAADRAKMLTEQLLGFARQGKKQSVIVDMHALINDTMALLRRTIDPAIKIETEFLALKPYVSGDPIQLQQVIMNLAINARDAVLPIREGIAPTINIITRNAVGTGGAHSACLEILFIDNGCGMSPEVQGKIFDPFFTTKEVGKGTGLGLSTAYGILHNHDGAITVESQFEKGTKFEIRLPCVANASKTVTHTTSNEKIYSKVGTGTVLVIDDHPEVLLVATNMLETLGYRVKGYSSGAEGIREMAQNGDSIDAAIVDLIMPGLSGVETIESLKKIKSDLPILVVSGFAQSETLQEIMDKGYSFLRKPFELKAISEALNAAMQREV